MNVIEDFHELECLDKQSYFQESCVTAPSFLDNNSNSRIVESIEQDVTDVYNFSKTLDTENLAVWHYIYEGVRIDIEEGMEMIANFES